MRTILDCIINKVKKESRFGSPIYLMGNVNQVTSQCGLNAGDGLCGEM